jgi:DNA invertase Pin-like site-specific DNA recombinase
MALIGYARVSTHEQHLHLQQDALSAAGCLKIFTDTISGTKSERKGLAEALDYIRKGDTLVVWRLDRLGRSLKDLIESITELDSRNIGFKSLTENIDTRSPACCLARSVCPILLACPCPKARYTGRHRTRPTT